jgi:hypothetical protein
MIGILGSGFGLYGYVPALIDVCHKSIILPERYFTRFNEREELKQFNNKIEWAKDEVELLKYASGVVLALSPIKQSELIPKCLVRGNIKFILLEKPLAVNPSFSTYILNDLIRSRKKFRLSYIFRYTHWGKKLLAEIGSFNKSGIIKINWKFTAHHFRTNLCNWKRFHSMGGGVVRFYGIHLIALLSEIGYSNILISQAFGESSDELQRWIAIFEGVNLPNCEILIDTKSEFNEFSIRHTFESENTTYTYLESPLSLDNNLFTNNEMDPRINLLSQHFNSLWDSDDNDFNWYSSTNFLWSKIEKCTKFLKKI